MCMRCARDAAWDVYGMCTCNNKTHQHALGILALASCCPVRVVDQRKSNTSFKALSRISAARFFSASQCWSSSFNFSLS